MVNVVRLAVKPSTTSPATIGRCHRLIVQNVNAKSRQVTARRLPSGDNANFET
jgi:predicted PP-loop superfamily ATPase